MILAAGLARGPAFADAEYQPDLMIRVEGEADYAGDNIYNTDATDQERQVVGEAFEYANFEMIVQNDGTAPDSFAITHENVPAWNHTPVWCPDDPLADWYYPEDSYTTPVLGPGETLTLRIVVPIEPEQVPELWVANLFRAVSVADPTKQDCVNASVYKRPDVNTSVTGGAVVNSMSLFEVRVFGILIGNMSETADISAIADTKIVHVSAAPPGWGVWCCEGTTHAWYDPMQSMVYWIEHLMLQPGGVWGQEFSFAFRMYDINDRYLWVVLSRLPHVGPSTTCTLDITARSVKDPDSQASCQIIAHPKPCTYRPDLAVAKVGEWHLAGLGIYNDDAAGQQQSAESAPRQTATFQLLLENDCDNYDVLTLIGPPTPDGWSVRYLDESSADITSQVTGDGWQTPRLCPSFPPDEAIAYGFPVEPMDTRVTVEVTPNEGAPLGSEADLFFRVGSAVDPAALDTARIVVTRGAAYRPDMHICANGDAAYLGDDVYNTTGEDQTREQAGHTGQAAVYHVRVFNDGDAADSFRVTGPPGDAAWGVQYLDYAGGEDITEAVTGEGWTTPAVARGLYHRLMLRVTPSWRARAGNQFAALMTATSLTDGSQQDAVQALTTGSITYRPDGMIHNGSAYLGDDIYNTSGAGQTHGQTVHRGNTAVYHVRLYNDGNAPDSFCVGASRSASYWKVRYFDYATGIEITTAATTGGWITPPVAPLLYRRIQVEVTPSDHAPGGGSFRSRLMVVSQGDSSRADAVASVTTCAVKHRPDAMVYDGSSYLGDEVFNTSAYGQTVFRTVAADTTAVYHVRLYNDGNAPDRFCVGAPPGTSYWRVRYFDYATGIEITTAATTGGWITPPVAPRLYQRIRVEVTPSDHAPGGGSFSSRLMAVSQGDRLRADAVRTVTTCAPAYRPDGMIHNGSVYLGDGVYNATGLSQTHWLTARLGGTATYHVRFYNDGNTSERLRLTGPAGDGIWTVAYIDYSTGRAITSAVTSSGWLTPLLRPGQYWRGKILVTPGPSVPSGATLTVKLTGTSERSATKRDAVKTVTTRE